MTCLVQTCQNSVNCPSRDELGLESRHEVISLNEHRDLLLRRDVLRAYSFWREEMAELGH